MWKLGNVKIEQPKYKLEDVEIRKWENSKQIRFNCIWLFHFHISSFSHFLICFQYSNFLNSVALTHVIIDTSNVIHPPKTTEGTVPIRSAVTPLSN